MLAGRFGVVAFGVGAAIAVVAGAACSQSYAGESPPSTETLPEASTVDAPIDAELDASVADTSVPPAPKFVELATGLGEFGGIAASETTVYVTLSTQTAVKAIPIAGGLAVTIAGLADAPGAVVLSGKELFWATPSAGMLSHLNVDSPGIASAPIGPDRKPFALAASSDRLLVATAGPGVGGEIQLYTFGLATVSVITSTSSPSGLALAGTSCFWTVPADGEIQMAPLGGASGALLRAGESGPESITANGAGAYWTSPSVGVVRGVQGGAVSTLGSSEISPASIVADESDVYWLTGDGKLRRKRLGQELPPATLASGFKSAFAGTHVSAITLTSKYVVWITTDGRVLRVDK